MRELVTEVRNLIYEAYGPYNVPSLEWMSQDNILIKTIEDDYGKVSACIVAEYVQSTNSYIIRYICTAKHSNVFNLENKLIKSFFMFCKHIKIDYVIAASDIMMSKYDSIVYNDISVYPLCYTPSIEELEYHFS